ncbi:thrombospondin related sporozoite protein, putative [Plasmodium ovale curtisi]|uniref:Thrombospondin related sporozoite protein, putative n=1 Tax=Plasmodium ovale curtisi TaxID=864141 RepID=A0A1A8VJM6_PLAOA|nr:thrombospondin related sporozoite protein, putative [Plasmodium ovale curtisi]SBS80720.1 thrombospondin related sporozoite protein, putative [Plasmodium ovale curtisi]
MLISISRYFFFLFLIKSHFNFLFGHNDHSLEKTLQTVTLLSSGSILKSRLLKEENKVHCDTWSEWTACSKTCDVGVKMRVRSSSDKEKSRECSNVTETSVCFIDVCPETPEKRAHDKEEREKNEKKKIFRKYLLIFTIFSAFSIILLLICVIVSIKKKII